MGEEVRFHQVSWPKLCSLIFEGGWGVWNLLFFYRALLGKRLWCCVYERGSLKKGSGCEIWQLVGRVVL